MKNTENEISSLAAELKAILTRPEIQLHVHWIRMLFRQYIADGLNSYDFELKIDDVTGHTSRIYADQDMKEIESFLEKTRKFLEKDFAFCCRDFDLTWHSLCRWRRISTHRKKMLISEEFKSHEKKSIAPQWKKETNHFDEMMGLKLVYTCLKSDSPIRLIQLLQRGGDHFIQIGITNKDFKSITECLTKNGYPNVSDFRGLFSTRIPDLNFMDAFLEVLILIESAIDEIYTELFLTIKPHLPDRIVTHFSGWLKQGDLNNSSHNNTIQYVCHRLDVNIRKIQLTRSPVDGRLFIGLKLSEQAYGDFLDVAFQKGYHRPIEIMQSGYQYSTNIADLKGFENFLNMITQFDTAVPQKIIEDMIKTAYPDRCSSFKMSFLMGLHPRVGENSAIKSIVKDEIFEKNLFDMVFSYL